MTTHEEFAANWSPAEGASDFEERDAQTDSDD